MGLALEGPKLHKSYRLARAGVVDGTARFQAWAAQERQLVSQPLGSLSPPSSPRSYNLSSNTKVGRGVDQRGQSKVEKYGHKLRKQRWRNIWYPPVWVGAALRELQTSKTKPGELGTKISGWKEASGMPKTVRFLRWIVWGDPWPRGFLALPRHKDNFKVGRKLWRGSQLWTNRRRAGGRGGGFSRDREIWLPTTQIICSMYPNGLKS